MTSTTGSTVVVADDHPVFREAVAAAIEASPGLTLAAAVCDGPEALAAIRRLGPDVAVLDLQLPGLSGLEVLSSVVGDGLSTRVMIVSASASGELVRAALMAGAAGYVSKAATLTAIREAVHAVARGETAISPEVQSELVAAMRAGGGDPASEVSGLTARELQILRLIATGKSAPEIAEALIVSASTVKTHIRNLFEKLDVNDRAAAVAEGMRRGLLE